MKTLVQLAHQIVDAAAAVGLRDVIAKAMDRTLGARIMKGWSMFASIPYENCNAHINALVEETRVYARCLPVQDAAALSEREAFFDSQLS